MTPRPLNELKEIFLSSHRQLLDENLDMVLFMTDSMLGKKESSAKESYLKLKDRAAEILKEKGVTPEELIIINSNSNEWMKETIPHILETISKQGG